MLEGEKISLTRHKLYLKAKFHSTLVNIVNFILYYCTSWLCIPFKRYTFALQVYCLTHIILTFFLCKSEKGRWYCKIGHKIQIMACSVKSSVTFKIEFPESHNHLRNDFMVLIKRFLNFIDQLPLHRERKATATWDSYYKSLKPTRLTGYRERPKQSKLPSEWKWHLVKWINEQRKNYSFILCNIKNPAANYAVYVRIELIIMNTVGLYVSSSIRVVTKRQKNIHTIVLLGWE